MRLQNVLRTEELILLFGKQLEGLTELEQTKADEWWQRMKEEGGIDRFDKKEQKARKESERYIDLDTAEHMTQGMSVQNGFVNRPLTSWDWKNSCVTKDGATILSTPHFLRSSSGLCMPCLNVPRIIISGIIRLPPNFTQVRKTGLQVSMPCTR